MIKHYIFYFRIFYFRIFISYIANSWLILTKNSLPELIIAFMYGLHLLIILASKQKIVAFKVLRYCGNVHNPVLNKATYITIYS